MLDSLTSIILSHFILDLRCIYQTSGNLTQSSDRYSTVQSSSAIEGNIGASLVNSWTQVMDEQRDIEDERIQYSEYPFVKG